MKPIQYQNTSYSLEKHPSHGGKQLLVEGDTIGFTGHKENDGLHCPLTAENAAELRRRLPWLNPQPLGLATSFGFGDRLGPATPGHLRAVRGTGIAPIFAQQSVRENARTKRTPQIVLDDAMWAVFELDWRDPWGGDADHIKEIADLQPFLAAGYTFYTIDPNLHVDNAAHNDLLETLREKAAALPWDVLQTSLAQLSEDYLSGPIILEGITIKFEESDLLRALCKYGQAVAHIKTLADYLATQLELFDLEASVDETDTPTSVQEHYFIASELRRLNVPIVSLAPRFIGSFEKGVDYIGDLDSFEAELARHAAVMHALGGYKMSIHTGSDKFSIYSMIAREARNLVHVKTAGTSYLEALKVVATREPGLFREILDFCRGRYDTDRATYHVSGQASKVPAAETLTDAELLGLFEFFDARQVLHVTFGSVLDRYGDRLMEILHNNLEVYEDFLYKHFRKHLEPFTQQIR